MEVSFTNKYQRNKFDFVHSSIQHNNRGHHAKSNLNNILLLFLGLW